MVRDTELKEWFCQEVLPLESSLSNYLRLRGRVGDVSDALHDVYERTLIGAARMLPTNTASYVFKIAKNYLIDRARRLRVVDLELVMDLENQLPCDELTPERYMFARDELKRVQAGLDRLPPQCRRIIWLRKVEGLSAPEVSSLLGIGIDAVEQQSSLGMRALIDFMMGGLGRIRRRRVPYAAKVRYE